MGVRTRRAHKHSQTHFVAFAIAGLLGFFILGSLALFFSIDSMMRSWLQDLPDYTSADAYLVAEPTHIYDINGDPIAEFYLENRRSVTMEEVSPWVLKGIVDTEDKRFYSHNGVDTEGVARAIYVQLAGGSEGASTITQQLVRNTVLRDEMFDRTLKRKVREAYIAIQMEKTYSKDQILMMYLNTIFFGHGAYGIETASLTYFGKHASELSLSEAAMLAGLPQSPTSYDPTVNPDLAVKRRNIVLDRMRTAGDISDADCAAAQAEPLVLNITDTTMDHTERFPFFVDYVRGLLEQDFDKETIFKGGLEIYTSIDPTWQEYAEQACAEGLARYGDEKLEAAMVAIDPENGYIKAMVGGRDYNARQFNLATMAKRQPGSSFKAFTLSAAVSQGMNPQININCNSPLQVTPSWRVINYFGYNYGVISLARATEVSSNTGYAQVAEKIGAESIVDAAHAMGIDEILPAYPSITLGSVGVPVVQMAEGYATLAANGVHHDAVAITKIVDRSDNVIYQHSDASNQALQPEVASAVTSVLEGVVNNGTADVINQYKNINQPIAGKTGTTEETRDLWFCGYTPQVAVAIWDGYPDTEESIYVNGSYGHPYDYPCRIFSSFTNMLLSGVARVDFPKSGTPSYVPDSEWAFENTYSSGGYRQNYVPNVTYGNGDNSNNSNQNSNNQNQNNQNNAQDNEQGNNQGNNQGQDTSGGNSQGGQGGQDSQGGQGGQGGADTPTGGGGGGGQDQGGGTTPQQ